MTLIEDSYPLSPVQQGMLFNTLLEPTSGVDIVQVVCYLHEELDVAAFQRAWRCVVSRHPALRTNLRWEGLDEPQQEVLSNIDLPWEEQDRRGIAEAEREKHTADFMDLDRRRGFDLTRAPLFRLTVFQYATVEFHFVWTLHHSILDGRSFRQVLQELFAFYECLRQGKEMFLPLPRRYRDFVDWLQQQDFSKHEDFWRESMRGFKAPTSLVVDHAEDSALATIARYGTRELILSAQVTSSLRAFAERGHVTLNTLLQGAWAVLLSRYSGETDVVIGVIRANRRSTIEGAEAMIGLFVNTLPLRVRVDPESRLTSWLREVRRTWMEMRDHEHTPLAMVQAWSDVPPGSPLFHSTLMFENYDLNGLLRSQGGGWSNRRVFTYSQTNYPVNVAAYDGPELRLQIDFDGRRIEGSFAERMLGHLQTLLEGMGAQPERKLCELPFLTPAERHHLIVEWNATESGQTVNSCLHELFEAQVDRSPDRVAVTFEDRQLSFRELNGRSNQLALHLRDLGVGPDVLVGVCVERSLEMVVGLLAILKAGGAYVPIDPSYPAHRISFMLNDSGASVLLAQRNRIEALAELKAIPDCRVGYRELDGNRAEHREPAGRRHGRESGLCDFHLWLHRPAKGGNDHPPGDREPPAVDAVDVPAGPSRLRPAEDGVQFRCRGLGDLRHLERRRPIGDGATGRTPGHRLSDRHDQPP